MFLFFLPKILCCLIKNEKFCCRWQSNDKCLLQSELGNTNKFLRNITKCEWKNLKHFSNNADVKHCNCLRMYTLYNESLIVTKKQQTKNRKRYFISFYRPNTHIHTYSYIHVFAFNTDLTFTTFSVYKYYNIIRLNLKILKYNGHWSPDSNSVKIAFRYTKAP